MSIAKDINELLDNILDIKAEIRRIDLEITPEQTLKNVQTGEKVNKEEVLEFVQGQITQIKNDLNKITNNGKNVKDIFTNNYYVNDMMQDREIVGKIKTNKNVSNKKRAPKDEVSKERQRREKANKHKPNKMTHEEWGQAIKNYKKFNKEQMKKIWKKYKEKNDDFYNDNYDDENNLPF